MYVKEIIQFSREDCEADICISDGLYNVICYAYPIDEIVVGNRVSILYGFGCSEIIKSSFNICSVKKLTNYYAHSFTAQVVSQINGIVQIGDLLIYLDSGIPNDIVEGDYVSFTASRLDMCKHQISPC